MVEGAIERRGSFHLIRLERMVKVDVFVPPDTGLHASKWARTRWVELDPGSATKVRMTSPEDILLQKLDGYRQGGGISDSQWRDVTSLLRLQGQALDGAYLDDWAWKMELVELLRRARSDAAK